MLPTVLFLLLAVLPSAVICGLAGYRHTRFGWLYALAAYAIGPTALVLFLACTSFKRCKVCGAECTWNASACRTCLQPFPLPEKRPFWHKEKAHAQQ